MKVLSAFLTLLVTVAVLQLLLVVPTTDARNDNINNAQLEETKSAEETDFDAEHKCQGCVVFSQALHETVHASQPGDHYTAAEKKKLIAREDHIEEVIDVAVSYSVQNFVWVNMNVVGVKPEESLKKDGKKIRQRKPSKYRSGFWKLDHLHSKNIMSNESIQQLEAQAMAGGDVTFNDFIRGEVLGDESMEEAVEKYVGKNELYDKDYLSRGKELAEQKNAAAWQPTKLMLKTAKYLCSSFCKKFGGVTPSKFPEFVYVEHPEAAPKLPGGAAEDVDVDEEKEEDSLDTSEEL